MHLTLYIEKGNPTEEIAKQFNFYYPYLKIEFYNKPFVKQQHASKKDSAETNSRFGPLAQFNSTGIINISGNRTVRELEFDIASLGLYGQVLRKSGHMWIETVLTNDWTLQHQNYEGEQISNLLDKGIISTS
ncbi:hypothetical protein BH10BAC3_BH10BAC3_32830 [soil metagenome]